MAEDEPLYENVQKEMEYIKQIDDRVINFLHVVEQAPRDIQKATDKFLASIDKLKKNYISNIVINKKIEAKHSATLKYYNLCQREYDFFRRQDDYLSQISAEEHYAVDEKLEMAKLECAMCNCQLQLSSRELELSREKLYRFSKRAEHLFLSSLRNHPEKGWAQVYKNDSQRPKSELKRVRSNPLVPNSMVYKLRHESSRKEVDCNDSGRLNSNTMRPSSDKKKCFVKNSSGRVITKSRSLDIAADNYSSDEEFPPPPPPLTSDCLSENERVVVADVIDRTKRYSERSAVDEGIGDIDWNPSSEDINRAVEAEMIISRITELTHNARIDNMDRLPKQVNTRSIKEDYSAPTSIPGLDENNSSELEDSNSAVTQKETNVLTKCLVEKELNDSASKSLESHDKDTIISVNENSETNVAVVDKLKNEVNEIEPLSDKIQATHDFDEQKLHNNGGVSDVISDGNTKSDKLRDTKLTDKGSACQVKPKDERKIHVYEDVPSSPDSKQKREKEKKKSKLKLFTRMFHGPWEGWEDL